jgi:hypothetical protein
MEPFIQNLPLKLGVGDHHPQPAIVDSEDFIVCEMADNTGPEVNRAAAEKICRAVNHHAELVDLLTQALRALHEDDFPQLRDSIRNKLKELS